MVSPAGQLDARANSAAIESRLVLKYEVNFNFGNAAPATYLEKYRQRYKCAVNCTFGNSASTPNFASTRNFKFVVNFAFEYSALTRYLKSRVNDTFGNSVPAFRPAAFRAGGFRHCV
jgi:hypothetical protein